MATLLFSAVYLQNGLLWPTLNFMKNFLKNQPIMIISFISCVYGCQFFVILQNLQKVAESCVFSQNLRSSAEFCGIRISSIFCIFFCFIPCLFVLLTKHRVSLAVIFAFFA